MNRSWIGALILVALLTGCVTSMKTTMSTAGRNNPSLGRVDWPKSSFPANRWTTDGDNKGTSCWCNKQGDWGITSKIRNHSIWCRNYRMGIEFGHMDNNDPNTFVSYSSQTTGSINLCGHLDWSTASGEGKSDQGIRDNFDRINAARPTMYEF